MWVVLTFIMEIIKTIKNRWKNDKFGTTFMGVSLLIAVLSFIKPTTAESIAGYVGFTLINLLILIIIGLAVYVTFKLNK